MTLDWIDSAFLRSGTHPARPCSAADDVRESRPPAVPADGEDLVSRLLSTAPREWGSLADAAAASARAGRPVIAVTGSARGEGRSTVAAGLAATLRKRGISVAATPMAPIFLPAEEAAAVRSASIVIVDGGPWFGPGPLRRAAVERAALGCDAAIVVRRDSAPPCPGRIACLEIGRAHV